MKRRPFHPLFCASVAVFLMLVLSSPAYAYLDPGTGSMILQGILGGLAAAAVVGRVYWSRILNLLGLKKDKSKNYASGETSRSSDN